MTNLKLLVGVIGGTLVLVLAIAFLFSDSGESGPTNYDPNLILGDERLVRVAESQEEMPEEDGVEASDSAMANEVVTIAEFSDFQCPACKASHPVVARLVANNPGEVRLVYRHFPLESIHPNARAAGVAAEAAARQEAFWLYHDHLFDFQEDWATESDPTEMFVDYARELGLNADQFEEDLEDPELAQLVDADIADGMALGVNSTPTFFVDGEMVLLRDLEATVSEKL